MKRPDIGDIVRVKDSCPYRTWRGNEYIVEDWDELAFIMEQRYYYLEGTIDTSIEERHLEYIERYAYIEVPY